MSYDRMGEEPRPKKKKGGKRQPRALVAVRVASEMFC